ncbi:uncharacterized protein LOC132600489 isoform X1 [Lycium barbarum]|uniref:uncharacterized protein LOC132600489 isoform X1 n=2 Tax=Lycium barbarum TaxID=112863 RepID=UPI00293E3AAA|nr:uncharacterized protein LOC132600489 isoform X1 [Lycium barbarum]
MVNGSEQGEIVDLSIRTRMKREFAMLMKSQAGWGIGSGEKRGTRLGSQNSPSNGGSGCNVKGLLKKRKKEAKNGVFSEGLGDSKVVVVSEELESNGVVKREENAVLLSEEEEPKSDVEVSAKKRKTEVKNGAFSEDLGDSKVVDGEMEGNGVVKREENLVLLSEEEEPKSDVVDCNSDDEKKGKLDEEVVGSDEKNETGEEGNADMQNCGDDTEIEMGKRAKVNDGFIEPMPEIVPELVVDGKDDQNRGDDMETEMPNTVKGSDCIVEAMPDIVPELAVTAEGDENDVQNRRDDSKTELPKTGNASDCIVEAMSGIVPELAVTAQVDGKNEQNCGDDSKTEMLKSGKASDCIVPEIVPELAVTAQVDGKNEQNCGDDMKTEMAKTEKASDGIVEAMPEIVPELAVNAQGDGKDEQKVLLQTPIRRFTRSALKPKEDVKVSQCDSIKIEEVRETDSAGTMSAPAKLELKMSKKVALTKIPTKLKDLLDTGLLEGLPVRYIRGNTKGRGRPAKGLRGEIRGSGILCFCDNCHGTSVVTPNQFELHANSANKRPPEYIYLENGKTLRDVLNMCKDASDDEVELVIKNAIGSADAKLFASVCMTPKEFKSTPAQISEASSRSTSSMPATKLTDRMPSGGGTQSKAHGKLTRKDLRMHKLVFEEGALPDGTELSYFVRGEKLLEGYKKGHGIYCYCCNTEVSPSQFEAHAGCASRRKPYLYIYTSNGVSLHELSIKLSKERRSSAEENDDLCSICADGGDLLCCDNCPRAFHSECVSLPSIPTGTWYCKYCENMFAKERFVENNANAIAAGRVAGVDAIEQITKRCIRMVEALDTEVSVCVLCRNQDFSKSGFGPRTVIICDQCEKEYHVGCLKEHNIDDLQELPKDKWFCCTDCSRIHFALGKLVSEGEQNIPESLLKLLKEKNEGKDSENNENNSSLDIKWRLLSGKMSSEETRVWLSGAVSIFHERFDPIADASTSRLDLIPHMVYGRNFKDQDYGGMFCAILLVNSLVVSAGIIRIFGKEVAELPLVATSTKCQGQGYFQSLFSCIENLLQSLNVENLVLPSAEEAESIWTNRFSFKKIDQEQLKNYRKNYQMMVFSGTSMLQKQVGSAKSDD